MSPTRLSLCLALVLAPLAAHAAAPAGEAARGFQPRDMATLDRYSSPTLSPDGRLLVFARRVVDFDANKGSTGLWIENLVARDTAPSKRLTPEGWNVNSPSFSTDGKTVYFLSAKSGSQQLYAIPAAGGTPKQVTELPLDVGTYKFSPDGKQVALGLEAYPDCAGDLGCTKQKADAAGKRKTTGVVFDRMFIRHWDAWNEGKLNRIFVAPLGDATIKTATLVGADVIGNRQRGIEERLIVGVAERSGRRQIIADRPEQLDADRGD